MRINSLKQIPHNNSVIALVWLILCSLIFVMVGSLFRANLPQFARINESRTIYGATNDSVEGNSRGYWTTPQELRDIKRKADLGIEPYKTNLKEVMKFADGAWPGLNSIKGVYTIEQYNTFPAHFYRGGYTVYAKAIAFHVTGDTDYASFARDKILDLTDITDFVGGDIPIMLGWNMPGWIQAADLLEDWSGWSLNDKRQFQRWLVDRVYTEVDLNANISDNNWGPATSYLNAMIADYVSDTNYELVDDYIYNNQQTHIVRTPANAYNHYSEVQLARNRYREAPWEPKSNSCQVNGIMANGGIPSELRRGDGAISTEWCQDEYIREGHDSALIYQQTYIGGGDIGHAEMMLRRGDSRLYDQIEPRGSGSILRAIRFVIANPIKSYNWDLTKKTVLVVAYRYYRDSAMKSQIDSGVDTNGNYIYFTSLTHGFASSENPGRPPVVPPPGDGSITVTPTTIPSVTTTPTPTISYPNLLRNGGFESGKSDWTYNTDGVGSFSVITEGISNNFARIEVESVGAATQLYQKDLSLQPNKLYRITMGASSLNGSNMKIDLIKHTSPFSTYGLSLSINPTSTFQQYESEFMLSVADSVTDARLRLMFRADDVYHIDDMSITEVVPADINRDRVVNVFDLGLLSSHYGQSTTGSSDQVTKNCDINKDNIINIFDLGILIGQYRL
ncbi:hypothetical protein HGA91_02710 [candidate division WWE3 bacterium]|nr:hypothetical protein [candidate division WWE3 bacterium]